jgi:hypothetical protein
MSDSQFVNENGSMPTTPVAVESNQQPEVKKYTVPINVKIEMLLSGDVPVAAADAKEALASVKSAIEDGKLASDINLQDGLTMLEIPYGEMVEMFGGDVSVVEGAQAVEA